MSHPGPKLISILALLLFGCATQQPGPDRLPTSVDPGGQRSIPARPIPTEGAQVPLLWLSVSGEENSDPEIDAHIVLSHPVQQDRAGHHPNPSPRFYSVRIPAEDGRSEMFLEVREPEAGILEKHFLPEGQSARDRPPRMPQHFSFTLRIPVEPNLKLFRKIRRLAQLEMRLIESMASTPHPRTLARKSRRLGHVAQDEEAEVRKFEERFVTPALDQILGHFAGKNARPNIQMMIRAYFNKPDHILRLGQEYEDALRPSGRQPSSALPPGTVQALSVAGQTPQRRENRIKIVFISEGFTESQLPDFQLAVQDKVDYLFGGGRYPGIEPFRTYRSYFLPVALSVASNASGSCHPEAATEVERACPDTLLHSTFNNANIPRLMGLSSAGWNTADSLLRKFVPDYDLVAVLVNDPTHGGAGGNYTIMSLSPLANETLAHELMGHTFAHLGDEYSLPYPGYPDVEEFNTTKTGDPDHVKWRSWLTPQSRLDTTQHDCPAEYSSSQPDPLEFLIGVPRQGAHYDADLPTKWYRPACACKMRTLGKPFCSVCQEGIVRAIYNKVQPVDSFSPAGNAVKARGDSWEFTINPMHPEHMLKIQWFVDGAPVTGANTPTLNSTMLDLPRRFRAYEIKARVWDESPFVPHTSTDTPLFSAEKTWKFKP